MAEDQDIKLSREQLYNEIWEISANGVAKKYHVPYHELKKLCKKAEIPTPTSGYWTKLSFGKLVTKTPLPDSMISEVTLSANSTPKRAQRSSASKVKANTRPVENADIDVEALEQTEVSEKQLEAKASNVSQDDQLTYRTVSGERNTYNREQLYKEVWAKPVVDVAVQYGVSDVTIHKICKSLNVPVPPRGYWSKLHAGAKLKKTPLPATKGATEIIGINTFEGIQDTESLSQPLDFLTESERQKVLLAAQQIQMPAENMQLHKKIIAYKSVVKEWNKK